MFQICGWFYIKRVICFYVGALPFPAYSRLCVGPYNFPAGKNKRKHEEVISPFKCPNLNQHQSLLCIPCPVFTSKVAECPATTLIIEREASAPQNKDVELKVQLRKVGRKGSELKRGRSNNFSGSIQMRTDNRYSQIEESRHNGFCLFVCLSLLFFNTYSVKYQSEEL